jgi:hypothetical protein
MAPTSTPLIELTVALDGQEYNCQLINPTHTPPAYSGTSTAVETACPDGVVNEESQAWTPGTLAGDAFADSSATGLTWILRNAQHTKATMTYKIVHAPELGPTGAIEETGDCKVKTFNYGQFAKPGLWKHPIDLELLTTSGPTRPVAV